jgi:hypothetical protein
MAVRFGVFITARRLSARFPLRLFVQLTPSRDRGASCRFGLLCEHHRDDEHLLAGLIARPKTIHPFPSDNEVSLSG